MESWEGRSAFHISMPNKQGGEGGRFYPPFPPNNKREKVIQTRIDEGAAALIESAAAEILDEIRTIIMEGDTDDEGTTDRNRESITRAIESGTPESAPVASTIEIPQAGIPCTVHKGENTRGGQVYCPMPREKNHCSRCVEGVHRAGNGRGRIAAMVIFFAK